MSSSMLKGAPTRALVLLSLLAVACGGTDAFLTGPSALQVEGTTIRGQLEGQAGGSSAGVAAFSHTAGVRVTVAGTGIATSTDSEGRFLLTGVPSGTVVIEFQGDGIDGRIELTDLGEGAKITITVTVSGSDVVLIEMTDDDSDGDGDSDGDSDGDVGFEGIVDSVGATSLVVDGRLVIVDASTEITRAGCVIALEDIQPGDLVEVEGVLQPDGSVLATEIEVEVDEERVRGEVTSVDPLVVDGLEFKVNECTTFRGTLEVGVAVRVDYIELPDGTLCAVFVKVVTPGEDDDSDGDGDSDSDSDSDSK